MIKKSSPLHLTRIDFHRSSLIRRAIGLQRWEKFIEPKEKNKLDSEIPVEDEKHENEHRRMRNRQHLSDLREKIVRGVPKRIGGQRRAEEIIRGNSVIDAKRQIEKEKHKVDYQGRDHKSKLFVSDLRIRLIRRILEFRRHLDQIAHADFDFGLLEAINNEQVQCQHQPEWDENAHQISDQICRYIHVIGRSTL